MNSVNFSKNQQIENHLIFKYDKISYFIHYRKSSETIIKNEAIVSN